MIKYILYGIYNLIYQLMSFFFFLYANTYLNDALVPESLIWKNNKPRTDLVGLGVTASIKTVTLIVEAAALLMLILFINKVFLNYSVGKENANGIVNRTAKINMILSFSFIVVLIWGSFRGLIW